MRGLSSASGMDTAPGMWLACIRALTADIQEEGFTLIEGSFGFLQTQAHGFS